VTSLPKYRQAALSRLGDDLNGDRPLRLAITGATGWLGSSLASMAGVAGLSTENGRLRLFGSTARAVSLADGGLAQIEALDGAAPLEGDDWLVAHFAFLGKERTVDLSPTAFAAANEAILDQVRALLSPSQATRVIFSSSGAAYGAHGGMVKTLEESPYGYLKVCHEQALTDWCRAKGYPLVIPRVFNVGGPHGNKLGLYAMSSLIQAAMAGGPLVIKARKPIFRSYVHVEELMAVTVALALQATVEKTLVFDTGGREVVELSDLAGLVCERFGLAQDLIQRDYDPSQAEDWYVGAPRLYQAAVAHAGLRAVTLSEILDDAVADLAP
jgi:nucleoside-diphosphate-sugar epimerase